jgi:hypothetical protein
MNCGNVVRFVDTVTLPAILLLGEDAGFLENYKDNLMKLFLSNVSVFRAIFCRSILASNISESTAGQN